MHEHEQLSDKVFHQLLSLIRMHRQHMRRMIDERSITPRELSVLSFVSEHNAVKVSQIQNYIHISASTMSTLVAKLEDAGYVIRKRSQTDRRVVLVSLTPEGKALLATTPLRGMPLLHRELQALSAERLTEMSDVLQEFRSLMQSETAL